MYIRKGRLCCSSCSLGFGEVTTIGLPRRAVRLCMTRCAMFVPGGHGRIECHGRNFLFTRKAQSYTAVYAVHSAKDFLSLIRACVRAS